MLLGRLLEIMEKVRRARLDNMTFEALGRAAHIEDMIDFLNEQGKQLLSDVIRAKD